MSWWRPRGRYPLFLVCFPPLLFFLTLSSPSFSFVLMLLHLFNFFMFSPFPVCFFPSLLFLFFCSLLFGGYHDQVGRHDTGRLRYGVRICFVFRCREVAPTWLVRSWDQAGTGFLASTFLMTGGPDRERGEPTGFLCPGLVPSSAHEAVYFVQHVVRFFSADGGRLSIDRAGRAWV